MLHTLLHFSSLGESSVPAMTGVDTASQTNVVLRTTIAALGAYVVIIWMMMMMIRDGIHNNKQQLCASNIHISSSSSCLVCLHHSSFNPSSSRLTSLLAIDGSRWRVTYQAIVLSGSEFGLLVKGVGIFGQFLNLGKFELFLGQEIVYRLWVFGIDVVDLGQIFLLR